MGMSDFPEPVVGMAGVLDEVRFGQPLFPEQYEAGFITDDEQHRLTVDNWTKVPAGQSTLAEQVDLHCGTLQFTY